MKKIYYGLIALCVITFNLQARLNIEITQGEVGGVPIAIATSRFEPRSFEHQSFEDLATVIRNDLRMCGRFAPLSPEQFPNIAANQETTVAPWKQAGAENVVLGHVTPEGNGRYTVSFKLLDVYKASQEGITLISKTYQGVPAQGFRRLAHQISDEVYQKLTGIRGAFSTRIAYVMVQGEGPNRTYFLEVADADGFNPVPLVRSREPIMSPSWSTDGRRLAFVSFEKNRAEIYILDVATGRRELISRLPGINGAPAWSPDGRSLALVLSKENNPKIYLMDLATKNMTQITQGYSIDTEPAWSVDGSKLYFTSNRGGKPQIYRLDLATNKVDRVTFVGNYNARPMLTPDGKYLVMMHREGSGEPFHIASQELATGQVTVLTHARLDESPTLSPNGAMVLYGTQDGERHVLGLVTLDGRGQVRLPAREGNVQEPAWSPFLS